jgi:hypothetical protein
MKYLGIVFNNNCTFSSVVKNLKEKGIKALFKLFKSFGNFTPSIKTATHLFDAVIKPILLYNSEIWGSDTNDITKLLVEGSNNIKMYYQSSFDKVHLRWWKYTLAVNSKSCDIAVSAELGRYPLITDIHLNIFKYWMRVKNMCKESFAYNCYIENMDMIVKMDKLAANFCT